MVLAALVLAAFTVLSAPNVKAGTSEAKVLSYSWYVAPSNTVLAAEAGDLVIVGEIQNVGSNIIGNASVEGTAYDSSGNVLATSAQSVVLVYHALPGQKAPFYIDFTPSSSSTNSLSWVSSVNHVSVSVTSVTDTPVAQYSGLAIPFGGSVGTIMNSKTYTVVGYINNTGSETVGDVWVVATFYNSAGTVVGLNYTSYVTDSLAPKAEVAFWATPTDNTFTLSNEIANYSIQIDSLPLPGATSPSPTPPPSTSNAQFPTLLIVVVVVVVVGAVLALTLLRKRLRLPPPPPPPPPPGP
jgi:hypothetical protein